MDLRKDFPVLIGMHKADAFRIMKELNINFRISEEDEVFYKMGHGFIANRVNLNIKNNVITSYRFY